MSKVIWSVGNLNFVFINFFYAILTAIFAIAVLTIPPQEIFADIVIMAILIAIAIAMTYVILRRNPVVGVLFTEDGLVVRGRMGFTVPRNVVVNGNVVCIRNTPKGLGLRVTHGSLDYTISLNQRQYDRLINALTTHWGWTPPQCLNTP